MSSKIKTGFLTILNIVTLLKEQQQQKKIYKRQVLMAVKVFIYYYNFFYFSFANVPDYRHLISWQSSLGEPHTRVVCTAPTLHATQRESFLDDH